MSHHIHLFSILSKTSKIDHVACWYGSMYISKAMRVHFCVCHECCLTAFLGLYVVHSVLYSIQLYIYIFFKSVARNTYCWYTVIWISYLGTVLYLDCASKHYSCVIYHKSRPCHIWAAKIPTGCL